MTEQSYPPVTIQAKLPERIAQANTAQIFLVFLQKVLAGADVENIEKSPAIGGLRMASLRRIFALFGSR